MGSLVSWPEPGFGVLTAGLGLAVDPAAGGVLVCPS